MTRAAEIYSDAELADTIAYLRTMERTARRGPARAKIAARIATLQAKPVERSRPEA